MKSESSAIAEATEEFLKRGGRIKKCPPEELTVEAVKKSYDRTGKRFDEIIKDDCEQTNSEA